MDTETLMEDDRGASSDHNALSKNNMSDTNDASAIHIVAVDHEPTEDARAQEAQTKRLRADSQPQQMQLSDHKHRFARPVMRLVDFLDTWDMFCLLLSHLSLASCAALRCAYKCYQNFSLIDILGDRLSQTSETLFDTHIEYGTVIMRLTPYLKSKVPFWKMSFDVRATKRPTNNTYNYQLSTELGSFSKIGTLMWDSSNMIMVLAMENMINECLNKPNDHSFTDRANNYEFSSLLHLWVSRWDVCHNPVYSGFGFETKVTDVICSKYPKTRFLDSGGIVFNLKPTPFWSKHIHRYYAKKTGSTFAICAKPGLDLRDAKPSHKHKLTPLEHILQSRKLTDDMMMVLCSFGVENVLQRTIDQDKVNKVAIDIKSFIRENVSYLPPSQYLAEPRMNDQVFLWSKEFDRYHILD